MRIVEIFLRSGFEQKKRSLFGRHYSINIYIRVNELIAPMIWDKSLCHSIGFYLLMTMERSTMGVIVMQSVLRNAKFSF